MKTFIITAVLLVLLMATAIHYKKPKPCFPAPAGDIVQVCQ